MGKQIILLHSIPKDKVAEALRTGLKASSAFANFGLAIRQGVIYCWLCKEDDKMSTGGERSDYVYLQVTVDEDRCIVADMDLISAAMSYEGSSGEIKNPEASRLLAEVYKATSVPLAHYKPGMFHTPEVLVKGDILPDCINIKL